MNQISDSNNSIEIPYIYFCMFHGYRFANTLYTTNKIKISDLYYHLENVKGIDYTKEKMSYNKDQSIERYYKISDRISDLEKQNKLIESYIKFLDGIFKKIEDQDLKKQIKEEYMKPRFSILNKSAS